jgi:hypothetical protein
MLQHSIALLLKISDRQRLIASDRPINARDDLPTHVEADARSATW